MKTDLDNSENESKRSDAILIANENYLEICNLSKDAQNKKYQYLPYWKAKESKLLLRELKKPRRYFNTYKRGTIVKIDFGVNLGCEFSQIHYAIVLRKKDNRLSETISVIPLTSKDKSYNLNIGNIMFDNAMKTINDQIQGISDEINLLDKNFRDKISKLKEILTYYTANPISSYACYRNIITVSKTRIMPKINEFDFMNTAICSESIMTKIDEEIIKYYTNYKL